MPVQQIVTGPFDRSVNQKIYYDQSFIADNDKKHPHDDINQLNSNVNSYPKDIIIGKSSKGSGGNYLSNEIFYRVARLRTNLLSSVKTGHFHVGNPNQQPTTSVVDLKTTVRTAIISTLPVI